MSNNTADMLRFVLVIGMALSGCIFWAFTFFKWLFDVEFDREPTGFESIFIYLIVIGLAFIIGVTTFKIGGLL